MLLSGTSGKLCAVTLSVFAVAFLARGISAAGPREDDRTQCARYSLPASLVKKPFKFAGETIPLERTDARGRITNAVNFLLLDARGVLTTWLLDYDRRAWIIEEILIKEGIPSDFALLTPVVSGMVGGASGRLPGAGWWAIDQPCTQAEGVPMSNDSWRDDRLDLELSTACFAARLKSIKKELGTGSWLVAAAAYLSSTKAISGYLKSWNTDDLWTIPLPDVADELLTRWIALGIIKTDSKALGLELQSAPPLTYDGVTGIVLAKDLPVAEIARMTGTAPRRIMELNPKIKPGSGKVPSVVNGKRLTHSLAAPKGKGRTLVEQLGKHGYLYEKR